MTVVWVLVLMTTLHGPSYGQIPTAAGRVVLPTEADCRAVYFAVQKDSAIALGDPVTAWPLPCRRVAIRTNDTQE